ncbi:MAG TPA: I78 family peptidase inhibitor [Brevundimonas sp.]|nr:I78 family peptidase inhibitor [Brevundimonas sp.]
MRLIVLSLATVATLAACTEQAPAPAPAEETPAPAAAEPRPTPPAANDPATPAPTGACGAAERQDWIGRARSDLPSPPADSAWRIYETGQPVTMDYNPGRLNIEIDPDSQAVIRLTCG